MPKGQCSLATALKPPTLQIFPEAIGKNIAIVQARSAAQIMAVVKADGYGHGALTVARAAIEAGVQWIGTTDFNEAVKLREAEVRVPILTWLNPAGFEARSAVASGIDVAVGSIEELRTLLEQPSAGVRVHLHLDTGMAREGVHRTQWDAFILRALEGQRGGKIRVVGLMGHLPLADQADPRVNEEAVSCMREAKAKIMAAGFEDPLTHLSATAAALTDPAAHFGMIRLGAGLVGIDPSGTTCLFGTSTLSAPIMGSTTVKAGTPVGYGGTYVTDRETRLSTLPVGYADGIPREISANASVEINGHRYPVVGRVSMDQIIINTGVTYFPRGTRATIFGPHDGVTPTIHDWARWAGTIPHNIVTNIGCRVRRSIA